MSQYNKVVQVIKTEGLSGSSDDNDKPSVTTPSIDGANQQENLLTSKVAEFKNAPLFDDGFTDDDASLEISSDEDEDCSGHSQPKSLVTEDTKKETLPVISQNAGATVGVPQSDNLVMVGGKTQTASDDDSDEESESGDSVATIDLLGGDPLYLVLSEFFVSKKKENIVDVIDKLNDNLEKLYKLMSDK